MKTTRRWVGSVIAIVLFAVFGASSAQAQATKKGWWIRINKPKTEASAISFQVGTSKEDSQNWRTWKPGQRVEFDLPAGLRNVAQLYLRATSNPHDKQAQFCVFYKDHGVEHFEFEGDQDHRMKPDDSDDDCRF